jgi:hypothetical protein
MRYIDAGIAQGIWEPWMLEHWERCPECRETDSREIPQRPVLKDIKDMSIEELIDVVREAGF